MVAIGRGGGGGRVRYMGNMGAHAKDLENDIIKKKNMSRFSVFNMGCFTKSDTAYCPSRLTDFYCVTWSASSDEHNHDNDNGTEITTMTNQYEAEYCGGDFITEGILIANTFLPLIVVLIGTFCNLITFRLLLKYAKKQLPICYYAAALEIINLIILYIRCMDLWLQAVLDIKFNLTMTVMDKASCQLYNGFYTALIHFKAILHVALILDVTQLMLQPTNVIQKRNNDWIRNTIILMIVVVVMVNTQFLWTLDVVQENAYTWIERTDYCGWTITWPISEIYTTWIWPLLDLFLGDYLAFFTIVICTVTTLTQKWKQDQLELKSTSVSLKRTTQTSSASLVQHIINVPLFVDLRKCMLACSMAYAILYFPQILHDTIMYVKFSKIRINDAQIKTYSMYKNVKIYNNFEDEIRLYVARVFNAMQLFISFFLLLIMVPTFRYEVWHLLTAHHCRSPTAHFYLSPGVQNTQEFQPQHIAAEDVAFSAGASAVPSTSSSNRQSNGGLLKSLQQQELPLQPLTASSSCVHRTNYGYFK